MGHHPSAAGAGERSEAAARRVDTHRELCPADANQRAAAGERWPGQPLPGRGSDADVQRQRHGPLGNTFNGARTAYVPNADVAAIKARTKQMQPLVLHVVAGECVTVNVTNLLTAPVGFSVGKLDRSAGSGGVNVGFDNDQNVAPNATRAYVYYVPSDKIGTATISDLSGATTLKSGLYGALVVAPASKLAGFSTEFSDPVTGLPRAIGANVIVHVPGGSPEDYRDFTVAMADDDARIGQDFMPYPTNAVAGRSLINYQAAPAGDGPNAFVNPGAVPMLTSYAGDPVVVHSMVAPGSESIHTLQPRRPQLGARLQPAGGLRAGQRTGRGPVGDL